MLAAMGAELNRMLYCVVVDDDVDSHDLGDVIWAISTRCRPTVTSFKFPTYRPTLEIPIASTGAGSASMPPPR